MRKLGVDHHDRRQESALIGVDGHFGAGERSFAKRQVVDPNLPEPPRAVVDVRVGHGPGLVVDEEDSLAVRALREPRHALDDVDLALFPDVVDVPIVPVSASKFLRSTSSVISGLYS
jgi:hypothetical protein